MTQLTQVTLRLDHEFQIGNQRLGPGQEFPDSKGQYLEFFKYEFNLSNGGVDKRNENKKNFK